MSAFRRAKNALLLAAVAALVVLSHLYLDRPIIVEYGGWRAAPPASVAVASALIAAVLLAFALKLLSLLLSIPARIAEWKKTRAAAGLREALTDGARALARDDHKTAFKAFSLLARRADADGAYSWLAAAAAGQAGDLGARDECLRRAAASADADIAAAAKAELAAAAGRDEEAFQILTAAGAAGGSPLLAKTYFRAARRRQKWPQALAAAYRLRDNAPAGEWRQTAAEVASEALAQIDDVEALRNFWKNNVAAEDQKRPPLLGAHLRALRRLGDDKTIADALERAVKIAGDSPAVMSAAAEMGGDKICETVFAAAQKRGEDKADDPEFLRAAAMLAARLKLWGRARRYYQMANSLRPDPQIARALEDLDAEMRAAGAENDGGEFARP